MAPVYGSWLFIDGVDGRLIDIAELGRDLGGWIGEDDLGINDNLDGGLNEFLEGVEFIDVVELLA